MLSVLKFLFLYIGIVLGIGGFPLDPIKRIAEGYPFDDVDNYLPKFDDVVHYQHSVNNFEDEDMVFRNKIKSEDAIKNSQIDFHFPEEISITNISENETTLTNITRPLENVTSLVHGRNITSENIELFESNFEGNKSSNEVESDRQPTRELNETKSDPEFESQEEESSEEEGNMVTGLVSAFLGGFSKPDGGIDLEAIVGLLGSLSSQNDDGTYDFQGLTELLRGFFGGGGDEGGGSDIGSFLGNLLGAVIKGVANPPGSKGAGIFTGKVVAGILPALSAPPPAGDKDMGNKPQGLDSGGFLSGLIKTVLSSSSGGNAEGGGSGSNLFQFVFQLLTSILSASSKSH